MSELNYASTLAALDDEFASASASTGSGSVPVGRYNAMIKEAFQMHIDDVGHLPLHQQMLAWGVSKKVNLVQLADNFMPFKWITLKK